MSKYVSKEDLKKLEHLRNLRWRARTDRFWFYNEVLGYNLLNEVIHGPVVKRLQHFPKPTYEQAIASDVILPTGQFEYTPYLDPYELPGPRRTLILDHRSSMKTTANTICDSLYWLINFPHLAIAMIFATDKVAQDTMEETKGHLQTNTRFRELFPDLVPHKRTYDWGTKEDFTIVGRGELLARMKRPPRKEPTIMSLSIDKSGTGYHVDMIKASDLVVPSNAMTVGERNKVAGRAGLLDKLLVTQRGWIYIEGTFYHPDDLHARLVKDWEKRNIEGREQDWNIFIRSIYKREMGDKIPTYTPLDLKYNKWKKGEDGHEIPIWVDCQNEELRKRFSWEEINKNRYSLLGGGLNWAYQYALDLNADETSDRPFACGINWKEKADFDKIPIDFRIITVDLADTSNERSNPTVVTVSAFDRVGRCYVYDIRRGKFTPEQSINLLFDLNKKYKPNKIFIEDYAYVHGLRPFIERQSIMKNEYPPFHYVKRDRSPNSKVNRIIRALQPPFNSGELMFVNPLHSDPQSAVEVRAALESELKEVTAFSTGSTDDILDTLADIYLQREWFGPTGLRVGAYEQTEEAQKQIQKEQYDKAVKEMNFGPTFVKPLDYSW
jgi:hypothetical protein